MPGPTSIEWTDVSWNPVTGCTKVSPGCEHCYAEAFAERFRGVPGHPYEQGFDLKLWPQRLELPLRWRKPRRIFVNSMSDLFHDRVPLEFIRRVFAVMEGASWDTFQILTKRSARLLRLAPELPWPANVWMGVSVENQAVLYRARRLAQVPAAVRFLSVEPMLGPVDLDELLFSNPCPIDWVIAGGESGPGARPCDPRWLRDLWAACGIAAVPFFLKQLGGHPDKRGGERALLDGQLWRELPGEVQG